MLLRHLPSYFFRGVLISVPAGLTIYILYLVVRAFDELLPIGIPGLGLITTAAIVTLIGFLSSNVIGRSAFDWTERILRKVPLVKLLYTSIKDLVSAFVGNKKSFDKPVAVRISVDSDLRVLGFVTRNDTTALGLGDYVAVYFPQSYNFAGNLLLVPTDRVEELQVSSTELMTFIVSGGISGLGVGKSVLPPPPAGMPPA